MTASVRLWRLERGEIVQNWPQIDKLLLDNQDLFQDVFTHDHILAQIMSENIQVWFVMEEEKFLFAGFSQFYNTFVMRVFQVFFAAGVGAVRSYELLAGLEKFAGQGGAGRFEIQGREGLWPGLKKHGFRKDYVVYSKPIKNVKDH